MTSPMTTTPRRHDDTPLDTAGAFVLRYGLALVFVLFGIFKFTAFEAKGVAPLGMHSPLLSWAFDLLGERGFAYAIGIIELSVGVLIALRPVSARLAFIGGIGACITFVITLSFLFSTHGVIQDGYAFPMLSGATGQFPIKDLVLLGASLWVTGEALRATRADSGDAS